jgi:pyruvate dehydrogenase E1 component
MGEAGEGQNITHQQKKLARGAESAFRDRFNIPISDEQLARCRTTGRRPDSDERCATCASAASARRLPAAAPSSAARWRSRRWRPSRRVLEGSGEREISTTMAFVRMLTTLLRDKNIGKNIVPIVPDEAAPSAWKACSASSASTIRGPALRARRIPTS